MKKFFVHLILLLLAPSAFGNELHVNVVSYNIKGLPSAVIGSGYSDARYPLIGRLLAKKKAEIVLLQEAFSDQVPKLLEAASYPHRSQGPGAASFLGVDSGLYILSQFPILHEAQQSFGSSNCLSWDCLSNKGVQMARISVPGMPLPLEIYNTHLQAGREDTAVRVAQVKTLLEFFRAHHQPGNPVIFAGDFNFRPGLGQESYRAFAKGTEFTHAGRFCLDNGCTKAVDDGWHGVWERAVDHQFYSPTGLVKIVPVLLERSYRQPVEGLKLSDHPSLDLKYRITVETAADAGLKAKPLKN